MSFSTFLAVALRKINLQSSPFWLRKRATMSRNPLPERQSLRGAVSEADQTGVGL
jgi:hypothetical protein